MTAYYNENNHKKAEWLRVLIEENVIAPGDVDERPIQEVSPEDVKGYTQCHWFAGIGVWSYALRLAGWDDDRPVWTGSCPCQSFSTSGMRRGMSDPRHLWPVWNALIQECRPSVVFGEQVEAAIRKGWLDLVQDDLEAENYSFGAIVLPACSVGQDHKRDRLYFMANTSGFRFDQWRSPSETTLQGHGSIGTREYAQPQLSGELSGRYEGLCGSSRNADTRWIDFRDARKRRVKSSIEPLVDVTPGHIRQMRDHSIEEIDFDNTPEALEMRIEGYGDAIVAELAAEFISVNMECLFLRSQQKHPCR